MLLTNLNNNPPHKVKKSPPWLKLEAVCLLPPYVVGPDTVSDAKTAEPIEMSFGDSGGSKATCTGK